MGKRSNFPRLRQDKYMTTDPNPVLRLQPFLLSHMAFVEPCAGSGDLIDSMRWFGHSCTYACDLAPGRRDIDKRDALKLKKRDLGSGEIFVTNPPWTREVLHPLIDHLSSLLPCWMLLDADWMHTRQAVPYLRKCHAIISVGRVKWFNDQAGVDNAAWYLFGSPRKEGPSFVGLT